jgi:hypothetical protein
MTYPVFCNFPVSQSKLPKGGYNFRSYTEAAKAAFQNRIQTTIWDTTYNSRDAQNAYSTFAATISDAYEDCFPLQQIQKTKSKQNPWMTRGLKKSIKIKNKLYGISKQRPNAYNGILYRRYKNILKKLIFLAKKTYYRDQLHKHRNNIKKTWEVLKAAIGHSNTRATLNCALVGHNLTTDTAIIGDSINHYFANVGSSLDAMIPASNVNPTSFLRGQHVGSLYLLPVTKEEILSCLLKLKDSSAGHDHLKPSIIKLIAAYIAQPLTYVINLCFQHAVFPSELKQANITPIFKKGDPSLFQNYRPISILPVFSKVFERLLHTRLVNFFDQNNVISPCQYGFRKRN